MNQKNHLTEGPVTKKLILLTRPMIFAMLSMVAFNLVDTFFVSRLGTRELAAMGFTFPVVMFIMSVALGFGVATSSLVSRAIGRKDYHQVKRLTTDSLIISVFIVLILAAFGWFSMDWMFRLLGADGETLPLVKQYMRPWYMGVVFVVIPMVGNSAIRACGDTLFPSLVMIGSMIINFILDPLLIFGLWGFPRLELKGAAIATVIARAVALVFSLLILHFKEKLIDFALPPLREFMDSVKQFSYIGIPAAVSRLLMPVTMAVIMRLVAGFGAAAVAAFGVSVKIEMIVFTLIMALATALIPFVGQNWGAKNFSRVKEAMKKSNIFSLWWGSGSFVVLLLLAVPLGRLFGKDIEVANYITQYLWIAPISYGLRGCAFLVTSAFNAMNKPMLAIALNLARMFILYIPLAVIGSRIAGLVGLFAGLSLANLAAGTLSMIMAAASFRDSCATIKFIEVKSGGLIRKVELLADAIWREHYTSIIGEAQTEYMIDTIQSAKAIVEQIKNGNLYYLICDEKNKRIGYFSVEIQENKLFLSKLYLELSVRGRGFGRQSLDYIGEIAKKNNCSTIWLSVNKGNSSSIKAYEKCGFKIIGDFFKDIENGFVMDDYKLEKLL